MSKIETRASKQYALSNNLAKATYQTLKIMLKNINKMDMRMRILIKALNTKQKTSEIAPSNCKSFTNSDNDLLVSNEAGKNDKQVEEDKVKKNNQILTNMFKKLNSETEQPSKNEFNIKSFEPPLTTKIEVESTFVGGLKVINRIHFGEFLLSDEKVKVLVDEMNEQEMDIVKKGKLIAFKI